MKNIVLSFVVLAGILGAACHVSVPPPTPVASVADVGSKIEASADAIVKAAQTANQTANPNTGNPILGTQALIGVAIAVDKVGRLGSDLGNALTAYAQLKAAGKDTTALAASIQTLVNTIAQALADVGKAVPAGTVATIDQSVATILGLLGSVSAAGL